MNMVEGEGQVDVGEGRDGWMWREEQQSGDDVNNESMSIDEDVEMEDTQNVVQVVLRVIIADGSAYGYS